MVYMLWSEFAFVFLAVQEKKRTKFYILFSLQSCERSKDRNRGKEKPNCVFGLCHACHDHSIKEGIIW